MTAATPETCRATVYDWTENTTVISTEKSCCIVTLAFDDEAYLISAAVLAHSLRETETTVDLVLFLSDTLNYSPDKKVQSCISLCKQIFDVVIIVTPLEFRVSLDVWPRFQKLYSNWLPKCFTKLYLLKLKPYEKALFMDSDMLVLHNIDHIFNLRVPFGTLVTYRKEGLETGTRLARRTILLSLLNSYGISGAFFCIQPNDDMFQIAKLHIKEKIRQNRTYYETPKDIDINSDIPVKRRLNAGPDEQIFTWLYSHDLKYDAKSNHYEYLNKEQDSAQKETSAPKDGKEEADVKQKVVQDPRTKWTNVSRQYNCVPWLKHKFEKGYFPLRYPNHTYDGETPERKVYVVHYVTEKPWVALEKTKKDANLQIWPDVKWWYDVYDKLREAYAPAFNEILAPLPSTVSFMSQEEADKIYEEDHQRLVERTREARARKMEERERERERAELEGHVLERHHAEREDQGEKRRSDPRVRARRD